MSEQQEKKAPVKAKPEAHSPAPQAKGPVTSDGCKFVDCRKKNEKFGFCLEHYELYMAGIVRGDGKKPIDYSQKLAQHLSKTKKAAA
jgi:hypothetical protein